MPLDRLDGQLVYEPDGSVLAEFFQDRSKVAVICGPIGSGTSSVCCQRIWATAMEQPPNDDGKRYVRVGIVRTTYPLLDTSTRKTWLNWFPEAEYGKMNQKRPMNQVIAVGDVVIDVWLLALDDESDVEKLRSTEFTIIWINELEFSSYQMFMECHSRVAQGRYPSLKDGPGPKWHGIIADMNAPPEDHFVARMAGWAPWPDDVPEEKRIKWPPEWWLRRQPPGLIEIFGPNGEVTGYLENPAAENRKWLKEGYLEVARGKTKQWIDARIMNRVTFVTEGEPVWKNFKPEIHLFKGHLPYIEGREVICSLDFGLRPCALFAQEVGDKLQVQCEFRMYGVGAVIFAPALKRFAEKRYRGARIVFTGDPKGADYSDAGGHSEYQIFESHGMKIIPAPVKNNNLTERLGSVTFALQINFLFISSECLTLHAALAGKYVIDKSDAANPEPMKRGAGAKYSDVADCLQYLCCFVGLGRKMLGLTAAVSAQPAKFSAKRREMRRIMA